jgi:hypothetical protein
LAAVERLSAPEIPSVTCMATEKIFTTNCITPR